MVAAANPNSEFASSPSGAREEGELPSDEDDDLLSCSVAPSFDADVASVPREPSRVASVNKDVKAGKSVSGTDHASSTSFCTKPSDEPSHCRVFEKNQVPLKCSKAGQFGPSRSNNDLVIRFSDDDSGSDSGESRQEKTSETGGRVPRMTGNRLLAPAQGKLHQTMRVRAKPTPRKMSFSRPYSIGPSSVWRGSRGRNFSTLKRNKYVASREQASNQGMVLNNSKLQDLREQIAMRERELKLKSAQQNKEINSGFDHNIMNSKNDCTSKTRATSAEIDDSDPDKPDRKRIKVYEAGSSQLKFGVRQELPTSTSAVTTKELGTQRKHITLDEIGPGQLNKHVHQTLSPKSSKPVTIADDSGLQDKNIVDCSSQDKQISTGRTLPSPELQVAASKLSLANKEKEGESNNSSCNEFRTSKHLDPPMQEEAAPSSNVARGMLLGKPSTVELRNPRNPSSYSLPSKAPNGRDCMRSSENRLLMFGEKTLMPVISNSVLEGSVRIADSKLENSNASLNPGILWNYLDEVNVSACGKIDMQSLAELEEKLDKELEEAQEHRHRCEVEERNALKAYRKAQKALVEANSRCTYLYRKREMHSAQFRSLIMEDSNVLFPSFQQNQTGAGLNSSNNLSAVCATQTPILDHQMRGEFGMYDQPAYNSALQFVENSHPDLFGRKVDRQNLCSKECRGPEIGTSELGTRKVSSAVNGVRSPSNGLSTSDDQDEMILSGVGSAEHRLECQRKEEVYGKNANAESKMGVSVSGQDCLLLEASLRSKLFARLGKKISKNMGSKQIKTTELESTENDDRSEKSRMSMDHEAFSETESDQRSDHEEESRLLTGSVHQAPAFVSVSPAVLSAFRHIKVAPSIIVAKSHGRYEPERIFSNYDLEITGTTSEKVQQSTTEEKSLQEMVNYRFLEENGSYTRNPAIDPFWPLCMYELRGKCNNEECPWQHVKDYSRTMGQHDDSTSADSHVGSLSDQGKFNDATSSPKCRAGNILLASPAYLVSLDILKADFRGYSVGPCWQKCFSTSLAVPRLLQSDLSSNDPFLDGDVNRLEVDGCWNRLSIYFQSRNGRVDLPKKGHVDVDQTLETVFLALNQDMEKYKGMIKALDMLSRALERDPTCISLWVVYLHFFYSYKSIGKDDMFYYAIKYNEGCYELWLMYINSQIRLDDRLVAYDTALLALCCHASALVSDARFVSACILDLVLQMMDCLCMSGDVGKVTHKISALTLNAADCDHADLLLLPSVLKCLTISDKCTFWVCCIYFMIYTKLPNEILQRFEMEKEFSVIEWPSVNLSVDDKQQAMKLMEVAADSVASYIDGQSVRNELVYRSAHMFAVNHVSCMTAISALESSQTLLAKYMQLYPTCLELILMSARRHDSGDPSLVRFEEALSHWPKEVPGVHCIWNQYAEYALQNGRFDFAKDLLGRWFHSVWKVQHNQNRILNTIDCDDGDNLHGLLELASVPIADDMLSHAHQMDAMFVLLNLSVYKLLQNNHIEAQLVIDKALKAAGRKEFMHCVREHAMFFLATGPQLMEVVSGNRVLKMLKGYLVDARASQEELPLSRNFIKDIKKARVHQLLSSILSPCSPDFTLVNLVLEVWYGPSLLPQQYGELKSLVDFVEAIMGIMPSNYCVAISACKLLSQGSSSGRVIPSNILFWASSLLVNAIFQAVPVAPEYVWVEAAGILGGLKDMRTISERFHKRALSVYPFSIRLWKSYLNLSKITENASDVVGAARERGIILV